MSNQSFALDIRRFVEKAKEAPRLVVQKAALELLTSVVKRSPVGNPDLWAHKPPEGYVGGRFRANWKVSLSAPDETTTDAIDADGAQTITQGLNVIVQADGEDLYITNSLPYAVALEYGHSGVQAPQGMVRVTVAEFGQYVESAVRDLHK